MEIIDNFLPDYDFHRIKNLCLGSNFPYYFQEHVASEYVDKQEGKSNFLDNYFFTHTLYIRDKSSSEFYNMLEEVFKPKLQWRSMVRMKVNLYPRTDEIYHQAKHVDWDYENLKGAIFSVNTNNGFTSMPDGTKVESVENRMVLFDPTKEHFGTSCTDQKVRCNINFNYF